MRHLDSTYQDLEDKVGPYLDQDDLAAVEQLSVEKQNLLSLYYDTWRARDEFVENVYVDGTRKKQKWQSAGAVLEAMTCQPCGGSDIGDVFHPYKCALGRCNDCPNLPAMAGHGAMTSDGPGSLITWSWYEHCLLYTSPSPRD